MSLRQPADTSTSKYLFNNIIYDKELQTMDNTSGMDPIYRNVGQYVSGYWIKQNTLPQKTKTQQCCKQGYIFNTPAHHGGVQGIGMLWKNLNVIFL